MSFFENPRVPANYVPPHQQPYTPFHGPPHDVVGAVLPVQLVLAKNEEIGIFLNGMTVFPEHFSFSLEIVWKTQEHRQLDMHFPRALGADLEPGQEIPIPRDMLCFGVRFSDGRKATSLAMWANDPQPDIILRSGSGNGGGGRYTLSYWVWPLPPEGDVEFAVRWEGYGIEFAKAEMEGKSIRWAASNAFKLWP